MHHQFCRKRVERRGSDGEKGREEGRVGSGMRKKPEQMNETMSVKYSSGFKLNIFIVAFLSMERSMLYYWATRTKYHKLDG